MRFFKSIAILVYFCIYLLIGGTLIVLALDIISPTQIIEYVGCVYNNIPSLKLILGIAGLIFIFIGTLSTKVNLGKIQREKTIAFENPDGQVVVSLSAIEEYIKRVVKHMPEVKELKSTVTANKKGIMVMSKATLLADANIPEVTEKIQSIIKRKLLEMLGIEDSIKVKIQVSKLVSKGGSNKEEVEDSEETSRHLPFRGME